MLSDQWSDELVEREVLIKYIDYLLETQDNLKILEPILKVRYG